MSIGITVPKDLCLDNPLWQFAGHFWSRSAAKTAALSLQEQGWSVTDILCALWLALKGCSFDGTNTEQVIAWRNQVTETLRQARKAISKNNPATDRARDCIARGELEAEKVELALAYSELIHECSASFTPHQSAAKRLALENLQATAPEKNMDSETGELLGILAEELQTVAQGERPSC